MNTNIKTTNITLTPSISEYIDKRLEKVSKILESDPAAKCDIEIGLTNNHHNKGDIFKAEIHIVGSHKNLYASTEQSDLYAALDLVRDDIFHQLTADKQKNVSHIRRGGARVKEMVKGIWPWGK